MDIASIVPINIGRGWGEGSHQLARPFGQGGWSCPAPSPQPSPARGEGVRSPFERGRYCYFNGIGVRGGGPGTTSHKVFPHSLPLGPFASLSRGDKNRFRFPRLPHHPPLPPLARGGKGSLARDVIPSRATETRVSKSSLQLSQHQLFTGPASPPSPPLPVRIRARRLNPRIRPGMRLSGFSLKQPGRKDRRIRTGIADFTEISVCQDAQ